MDAASGGNALLFAEWRYDPVLPALSRREPSGAWRTVPLGSRALNILGLLLEQRGVAELARYAAALPGSPPVLDVPPKTQLASSCHS